MKDIYKDRNFILMMTGKFISLSGNAIFEIALLWYILAQYGESSGKMLSAIMILGLLPTILLGGILGTLVDRYNKKKLMVIADLVAGFLVLAVTALIHVEMLQGLHLLIAVMFLSLASSLVSISVTCLIPEVFRSDDLYDTNAANQLVERVSLLLGLSVGGILVGFMGVEKAFLVNALSFIVAALLELFILYPLPGAVKLRDSRNAAKDDASKSRTPASESRIPGHTRLAQDFKDVWQFARQNPRLLRLTLVFTLVNFFWDPLLSIVVPYVLKNTFAVTSMQFGLLMAALPLGFILGAVYFSYNKKFLQHRHVIFYAILGANIGLTLYTIPVILAPPHGQDWLIYYLMFSSIGMGVFSAAINISASVTIQTAVPPELRGKFWGIVKSLVTGLIPIGAAIIGIFLGKINSAVFFLISLLAVYAVLILVPRSSYAILATNPPLPQEDKPLY